MLIVTKCCAGTLADQHKETIALIILGALDLVAAVMCLGELTSQRSGVDFSEI